MNVNWFWQRHSFGKSRPVCWVWDADTSGDEMLVQLHDPVLSWVRSKNRNRSFLSSLWDINTDGDTEGES